MLLSSVSSGELLARRGDVSESSEDEQHSIRGNLVAGRRNQKEIGQALLVRHLMPAPRTHFTTEENYSHTHRVIHETTKETTIQTHDIQLFDDTFRSGRYTRRLVEDNEEVRADDVSDSSSSDNSLGRFIDNSQDNRLAYYSPTHRGGVQKIIWAPKNQNMIVSKSLVGNGKITRKANEGSIGEFAADSSSEGDDSVIAYSSAVDPSPLATLGRTHLNKKNDYELVKNDYELVKNDYELVSPTIDRYDDEDLKFSIDYNEPEDIEPELMISRHASPYVTHPILKAAASPVRAPEPSPVQAPSPVRLPSRAVTPSPVRIPSPVQSPDTSPEGVPKEYSEIARSMDIPLEHLAPVFTETGLAIAQCYSALRYRRATIEEFTCTLQLSKREPIYCLSIGGEKTRRRILLPDLQLYPTTVPDSLDCFADYDWPTPPGDVRLLELKKSHIVMAHFSNLREPICFVCRDDDEKKQLENILICACHLNQKRDQERRKRNYEKGELLFIEEEQRMIGNDRIGSLPPPFVMSGNKGHRYVHSYEEFKSRSKQFQEQLMFFTKNLATKEAVAKYLNDSSTGKCDVWVHYYLPDKSKWKLKKKKVWIHHFSPHLIVSDKNGKRVPGILNLLSYSCAKAKYEHQPIPAAVKRTPHMTAIELLDNPNYPMFFSFETSEALKDFQQVIATLGYFQLWSS